MTCQGLVLFICKVGGNNNYYIWWKWVTKASFLLEISLLRVKLEISMWWRWTRKKYARSSWGARIIPELLRIYTNLTIGIFVSRKECIQEYKGLVSYKRTELLSHRTKCGCDRVILEMGSKIPHTLWLKWRYYKLTAIFLTMKLLHWQYSFRFQNLVTFVQKNKHLQTEHMHSFIIYQTCTDTPFIRRYWYIDRTSPAFKKSIIWYGRQV